MVQSHQPSQRLPPGSDLDEYLSSRGINLRNRNNTSLTRQDLLPHFRRKTVCILSCNACRTTVCQRGMKAILLADTRVELYSTDSTPFGVEHVGLEYSTNNCLCKIKDVACLNCGNILGYNVTSACVSCLTACNNGHYWMLYSTSVIASVRIDPKGTT
ncbi:hypothetical protein K493DRAFT_288849 [Basidiobolus meristosporus CBS 931.73]|uniref:Protein FAM72 n=1 Tax=Basidiobolus meristosporus CBS 931.73 TaxID=1314790 RepID=A0A1Y1XVW1_9FUNG|nr:hypothetical protein K493DRAFT_288849 [Basidiobolus meristosporus CBS 931.73]|eukprot:ORX89805.1 hypothetical protein K493DRAFT_288849 [Basidiobolus meristosporus CBS 931.73]